MEACVGLCNQCGSGEKVYYLLYSPELVVCLWVVPRCQIIPTLCVILCFHIIHLFHVSWLTEIRYFTAESKKIGNIFYSYLNIMRLNLLCTTNQEAQMHKVDL